MRASSEEAAGTLVFATRNRGKLREMRALLAGVGWNVEALPDGLPDYEETGTTFAENARGKALSASRTLRLPVLADDSGLEIDALNGEPGVRSARYIDASMTPTERNAAVLDCLRQVPRERRGARFVCHLALAYRGRVVFESTGCCEGIIAEAPRGDRGFGYDPVFLVPELGRTFAELDREEKAALSHRGAAARSMAANLAGWNPETG